MKPQKFKQYITVSQWLGLDSLTRQKLAIEFGIGKSTGMEIVDGKIVCDGTTQNDLKAMSVGAMIAYLAEDLEYFDVDLCNSLFTNVVKKFHGETIIKSGTKETTSCGECDRRAAEPVVTFSVPECSREHVDATPAPAPKRRAAGRPKGSKKAV